MLLQQYNTITNVGVIYISYQSIENTTYYIGELYVIGLLELLHINILYACRVICSIICHIGIHFTSNLIYKYCIRI